MMLMEYSVTRPVHHLYPLRAPDVGRAPPLSCFQARWPLATKWEFSGSFLYSSNGRVGGGEFRQYCPDTVAPVLSVIRM